MRLRREVCEVTGLLAPLKIFQRICGRTLWLRCEKILRFLEARAAEKLDVQITAKIHALLLRVPDAQDVLEKPPTEELHPAEQREILFATAAAAFGFRLLRE